MPRLNPIIAPALAAALGLGLASPALAHGSHRDFRQDVREYRHDTGHRTPVRHFGIRSDIRDLYGDISRAERRGTISHREAASLRWKVNRLNRSYARLSRNGLTRWETRRLESDVREVRIALRAERYDRDRRRG